MQTIEPYSVLLLWRDGVLVAAQRETKTVLRTDDGAILAERINPAEAIPLDLGEEVLGHVNSGLLARIEKMQADHAAEVQTLRDALAAAQAAPAAPVAGPVLTDLGAVFDSLPAPIQAAFAASYALVRVLVEAGRTDLARAHVSGIVVPAELEPTKAAILDRLQ